MKRFSAVPFLLAALLAAPHAADALLVNYEFEGEVTRPPLHDISGISEGTLMTGRLSFDTDEAAIATDTAPAIFDLPLSLHMDIGPYTVRSIHTGGAGAAFRTDAMRIQDLTVAPGTDTGGLDVGNIHLSVRGDYFDENPENAGDLEEGRWHAVDPNHRLSGWSLDTAENDQLDSFDGIFTRFALVGGPGGGPVAPVPEPATMVMLGTAMAGFAGARLRKRKKRGLLSDR